MKNRNKCLYDRIGRPIFAWLGSTIVAGFGFMILSLLRSGWNSAHLFSSLSKTRESLIDIATGWSFGTVIILVVTAIPMLCLIWLGRFINAKRGFWDIFAGSLIPIIVFFIILGNIKMITSELLFMIFVGAISGYSYWLMAGCPKTTTRLFKPF